MLLSERMQLAIGDADAFTLVAAIAPHGEAMRDRLRRLGEAAVRPRPRGSELPGTDGVWRLESTDAPFVYVRPAAGANPAQVVAVAGSRADADRLERDLRAGDSVAAPPPTQFQLIATRACLSLRTEANGVPRATFNAIVQALRAVLGRPDVQGRTLHGITFEDQPLAGAVHGWPGTRYRLIDRWGRLWCATVVWVPRARVAILVDIHGDNLVHKAPVDLRALDDLAAMASPPLVPGRGAPAVSHRQIVGVIASFVAEVERVDCDALLESPRGAPIRLVYALAWLEGLTPDQTAHALGQGTGSGAAARRTEGLNRLRGDDGPRLRDDLEALGLRIPSDG